MHFLQRVLVTLYCVSLCFVVWAQRETIGAWAVFREFDPITDGNTSWMYVDAWDRPVGVASGDSSLVVLCSEADGFLDVYVILDLDQARLNPNEYYNATYRMDRGELHEVRGTPSTDGEALFLAAGDLGTFVAEAVTASNFAIRIWDDAGEALTYQMDISGFAEAYAHAGFGDTCLGSPDLSDPDPGLTQEWESVGAWRVARRIDPITDKNTSAMIAPAWDRPAGVEFGDGALVIRCDERVGTLLVAVLLDDQERLTPFTGDEYYNATYRMDKGETHQVRGSSNGKAFHLFISDRTGTLASEIRTFVREAAGVEGFTFRIRDDRGTLLTYQMDITGFAEAYEHAGFDCLFAPDLATIDPAPSPPRPTPAYAGIGRRQWIREVASDGSMITFGDGSRWKIRPGAGRANSRQWQPLTSVEVELAQSPIGDYRYTLTKDGRVVRATYLGQSE